MRLGTLGFVAMVVGVASCCFAIDATPVRGRPVANGPGVQPLLSPIELTDGRDDFTNPVSDGGMPPIGGVGGYDGTLSGPAFGLAGPAPTPGGGTGIPKVPEPATILMLAAGGGLLVFLRRRTR